MVVATHQPSETTGHCIYCDDTGDVHGFDGEWRGVCSCEAGEAVKAPDYECEDCIGEHHPNATTQALFQAQEAAKELAQWVRRLEAAMTWIEDKARAGRLEIAPSMRGTGFEFGFWPGARALVLVGMPTLLDAVEAAQRPKDVKPGTSADGETPNV